MRILLALLFFISTAALADDSNVYLLAKVKMKGTTYGMVAFFYDDEVKDLASCEKERNFGRRGNWRRYGHYVNKNSGFSLQANYLCVQSEKSLPYWQENGDYAINYLVDVKEGQLKLTKTRTYTECLNVMRKTQDEESHDFFCAKSNQEI